MERVGSAAIGTGSKFDKEHRVNPESDEPAGGVNGDDWSNYAADPLDHELCAGCSRRGTAGRNGSATSISAGDAFKMHWGCAIGLPKGQHCEVRS
jgi:hypothetical protein